jgi:ubiquitin carboxyl-terminal hydrolase 8
MNSTRLENSLSLLPESQQRMFADRTEFDLVVAYDSSSSQWPRSSSGAPSPLGRLWDIIFEHEFGKKLQRNPVLLTGGYEAWVKYQAYRQSRYAGAQANGHAST